MKLVVAGATGLVGREILQVLEERQFPADTLIPVASERSWGQTIPFRGSSLLVTGHSEALKQSPAMAIFSAGSTVSREWAPLYAEGGAYVIDNSSAWRMDPAVPLVVPEINASVLTASQRIIANPNCSTIQLVLVLAPLHRRFSIKRVVVSTYQSVTGSGARGLRQLENERKGLPGEMIYPHPIDLNLLPHGGDFLPGGYTSEEQKLISETRKILSDPSIRLTATIVRVPVTGGHSESVNIEFASPFTLEEVRSILSSQEGITIQDEVHQNIYPMPLFARGKDDVFVGRIRPDESRENCLNLWIVADNLRKGAATNAVQIAEFLLEEFNVK
jgi:aspartate-semialdehyde dehydrogenase